MSIPTCRQYLFNHIYEMVFNMNNKASYYEKFNDNYYDTNNITP